MKINRILLIPISIIITFLLVTGVSAQYGGFGWVTAYQVVNMGDSPATIVIKYYDSNGTEITSAQKTYSNVAAGSSRLVVQFTDDPNLPSGQKYSAVISSDQPIAAITNQQLVPSGSSSYNPVPPFSTYSGQSSGASKVILPAVMYNWYNYYTEIFVMNVGTSTANDVDIAYIPGAIGGQPTGASGVTENNNIIPQYASKSFSQQSMTQLGAPSGTYIGRFLGSAVITADQPIIAVVNQHNVAAKKLMSYNGFTQGATEILVPVHMRGYFGYYSTILIANPDTTNTANVQLTYNPSGDYNQVESGSVSPVTVSHTIAPQTALTRYDGPGASDDQSDLDDSPKYIRFYGSVRVTSNIPVVVQVNIEALASGDAQAGSFNGIPLNEASQNIVVPVILADYYGYYTTLVVQNATNTSGTCQITYTSDNVYSTVKNHSASYSHALPASGAFTVYEGRKGGQQNGDINNDPTNWGANTRFIGAATIQCTVPAVAFVNEEADIPGVDSMYTFNTFNK